MAPAMRVACNNEGNGNSNEGNGNKGSRLAMVTRVMARAMVTAIAMAMTWAMAMAMRLAGDEKGKGGLQGQWQRQYEGGR